jgi:hypothetical protein
VGWFVFHPLVHVFDFTVFMGEDCFPSFLVAVVIGAYPDVFLRDASHSFRESFFGIPPWTAMYGPMNFFDFTRNVKGSPALSCVLSCHGTVDEVSEMAECGLFFLFPSDFLLLFFS